MAWALIVVSLALMCMSILYFDNRKQLDETRKTSSRLIADLHYKLSQSAYVQLEKGMDEQQESFEAEYLSWSEKESLYKQNIEWLGEDVNVLLELVDRHKDVCLPDLELLQGHDGDELLAGIRHRAAHSD